MPNTGKLSRFAAAVLAGIALLAIVAALAVWWSADGNRWIAAIQERASLATGRTVKIGTLHVQLLPWPALDATDVSIANPAWASAPQLVVAQRVSGRFALWPLLHGELQPASLSAQGVQVHPETNPAGEHSWTTPPSQAHPGSNQLGALDLSHITALTLERITLDFRTPHAAANQTTWEVEYLRLASRPGWQQMELDALVRHNGHELSAKAHFDTPQRGHITLKTGSAQMTMEGTLALRWPLRDADFTLQASATRPNDLLEFLGLSSRPLAPFSLTAHMKDSAGALHATGIDATLAKLHVTGAAQFNPTTRKPTIDAQLTMPRLDWVQTLADAGRPPLPPKLPGELFRTHRLAWRVLAALKDLQGTVDLHIGVLKTRPGVALTDASARLHFVDDLMLIAPMRAGMLGGSAHGTLQLLARDKSAHLNLTLQNVSLQQWIAALGKKAPLTGGPISLQADVRSSGANMKELGAAMTGPVSIRLGPTLITTESGARTEELLTGLMPIFSARKTGQIRLECATANLPFVAGRAVAGPLVGARSESSQLLTSGYLDLREQTLDLRGRVRARSGVSLGLSTVGGDVKITGLLTHPQARLDPAGTPAALARLGAAFATAGLSIVGTALWDGANPGADPCQAVFAPVSGSAQLGRKAIH